ncbi:hypothetical protein [Streptomyces sp. NPDC048106]|uniref:DUF3885 domain-containing protein n=1 Tax=Streptomyces sp. NPDC048106 TaxID=3155750 RepID=UPI00345711BA
MVRLDPEPAVFHAMLDGWSRQQRSRFLNFDATVKPRLALLKRFAPYDGGADVFLATSEERDRVCDRHTGWLSRYPSAL